MLGCSGFYLGAPIGAVDHMKPRHSLAAFWRQLQQIVLLLTYIASGTAAVGL